MALIGGGILWATQVPVHGHFWASLAGPFFIIGIGTAFAFIPVSIAGLAGVAEHEAGLASGLLNTSQQLGGAIGVADRVHDRRHPLQHPAAARAPRQPRTHRRLPLGVLGLRRDRPGRPSRSRSCSSAAATLHHPRLRTRTSCRWRLKETA